MFEQYCLILCTCPDEACATRLANQLVTNHLAACVNILSGVTSVYSWEGKIERGQEQLLLIKSKGSLYPRVEAELRKNHPYELPEIIAVPIERGQTDYLNWIDSWLTS